MYDSTNDVDARIRVGTMTEAQTQELLVSGGKMRE